MSATGVKTTYEEMGDYGASETKTLYCKHHQGSDTVTFYNEDGSVADMAFQEWSSGKDKWDAMQKLWMPFKDEWEGELIDGVERYYVPPWEQDHKQSQPK